MRLKMILAVLILISFNCTANTEKKAKANVDKAIVFTQGAQLFSSENFNIPVGTTDLIFENVSPYIDANSLQASGKGNFVITDVQYRVNYNENKTTAKIITKYNKEMKLLQDSIDLLSFDFDEINNKRDALTIEKNMLLNNKLIKGETKRDTLPVLKDALDYLRVKLNNINSELLKVKKEERKLNIVRDRMQTRLDELADLNNKVAQPDEVPAQEVHEVVVTVLSEVAMAANVSINYFVANAGWTPTYDLRANANSANIQLSHKASVYQNSGIEWGNAKLTLSTAQPRQNNIKPELSALYLNFYQRYTNYPATATTEGLYELQNTKVSAAKAKSQVDQEYKATADAQSIADYTNVQENFTNVEYEIKIAYSIPSDGKTHQVIIQNKELPTQFVFSAVPKLDATAYLMANITNWEDLNLIAGSSRIYYDGAYVGESYVNPNEQGDTLQLNLGRDRSIVIKRKKLKDKSKEKILNNDKVQTVSYEVTIRNTKDFAIKMQVDDQIPVSQNEEIKIKLVDADKAKYDELTGKLSWNIDMKPKETKKMVITYEVKYPSNKALANL